jgi:hypothetical protein
MDGFSQKTRTDRGFFCAPMISHPPWRAIISSHAPSAIARESQVHWLHNG